MTQEEELKKGRREIRKAEIVQGKREQERESVNVGTNFSLRAGAIILHTNGLIIIYMILTMRLRNYR